MIVPTNGIVVRRPEPAPRRPLDAADSAVTPGQTLHRCTCGRLFQPRLRVGRTYGDLTAVSADPSRCSTCQPSEAASVTTDKRPRGRSLLAIVAKRHVGVTR